MGPFRGRVKICEGLANYFTVLEAIALELIYILLPLTVGGEE